MKTNLAEYEEGLFDLRGGITFFKARGTPFPPPPQRNPGWLGEGGGHLSQLLYLAGNAIYNNSMYLSRV